MRLVKALRGNVAFTKQPESFFPLFSFHQFANAPECPVRQHREVREAETELLSSRIMLNLCRLLEAGCERTPGTSDIN